MTAPAGALDERLYLQVLAALQAVHAPGTSNAVRKQASTALEQFKAREDCVYYALHLVTNKDDPRHNDAVRHFGLHVLHNLIRARWKAPATTAGAGGGAEGAGAGPGPLPEPAKAELRRTVLQLLRGGTRGIGEKRFIKEKAVALVVEVAKRDWPPRWPSLLGDLVGHVPVMILQRTFVD